MYAVRQSYAIKYFVYIYLRIHRNTKLSNLHMCMLCVCMHSVDLVINMDMPKVASDYIHRYTLYTI